MRDLKRENQVRLRETIGGIVRSMIEVVLGTTSHWLTWKQSQDRHQLKIIRRTIASIIPVMKKVKSRVVMMIIRVTMISISKMIVILRKAAIITVAKQEL